MASANLLVKPNKRPVAWAQIKLIVMDCDGVLTDGRIIYGNNDQDIKHFDAHDGMGFMILRQVEIPAVVVTGRSSEALNHRCKDLQIQYLFQGVANKFERISQLFAELQLDFDNIVYIGDDWNDIPCMRRAALSVAPADALPEIKKIADMVTEHGGGRGAVRETINFVLQKKGLYERAVLKYLEGIGG